MSIGSARTPSVKHILAAGCATASLSTLLFPFSIADAGLWFRKPPAENSTVESLAQPAPLPIDANQIVRPLEPSTGTISQTAGRRLRRRHELSNAPRPLTPPESTAPVQQPESSPPQPLRLQAVQPAPSSQNQYQDGQALSPIERELQRLYAADGNEMPQLPDVRSEMTEASPTPVAVPQPAPVPSTNQNSGIVSLDDEELETEEVEVQQKPKRGLFGLFRRGDREENLTPLQEPDPFVPPQNAAPEEPAPITEAVPSVAEPVNIAPIVPSPDSATETYATPEPIASEPSPEPEGAVRMVHPLRAHNYSTELFGETPQQAPEVVVPATPAPTPTADEDLIILETPEPAEPSAAENGLSFNNPDDASVAPNESLDLDLSLSPDDASPTIQMPDAAQQVTQPAAQPEEFQEEPEEESFNPYTGLRLDQPKWNQPEQKQAEAAPIDEFQPVEDEQSLPPLPPQAANGSSGSQPQKTTAPVLLPPAQTERTADDDQLPSLPILITDAEPALMGYCPVTLRDARQLQKGQREFASDYEGRSYVFVSEEAKQKFHRSPEKYAPAAGGADVILFAQSGSTVQGSLNHSVWYQGRLYLFSSSETLESFATRPASHAVSR